MLLPGVAGNRIDEAITQYTRRKYNLIVGERTAEDIKINIGSATLTDKLEKWKFVDETVLPVCQEQSRQPIGEITEAIKPHSTKF